MKTYVVPLRGQSRGVVGWISGTLADKIEQCGAGAKTLVKFPGRDYPLDMKWLPVSSLREATEIEKLLTEG